MSISMNMELGVMGDGGVILVCDRPMPYILSRVEYYREQKIFALVYDNDDEETDLTHYEIPVHMAERVEKTPNIIIYTLFPDHEPIGYKVPLIKVGEMYPEAA